LINHEAVRSLAVPAPARSRNIPNMRVKAIQRGFDLRKLKLGELMSEGII
jgi:hypothetical protein